jgi:uncharacterized SAM-binding protein YcdF (DUF218 family)
MRRKLLLRLCLLPGFGYATALSAVLLHGRTIPFNDSAARLASGLVHAVVFYHDEATHRSARVRRGVERFQAGAVDGLITVGGYRRNRGETGSSLMAAEAARAGVAEARLQQDATSYDTLSNLRSAGDMLRRNGSAGVELISDRLHLARIQRQLGELGFSGQVRFIMTNPGDESLTGLFARLNYELAAYGLLLLPRSWSDWLTVQVREAEAQSR